MRRDVSIEVALTRPLSLVISKCAIGSFSPASPLGHSNCIKHLHVAFLSGLVESIEPSQVANHRRVTGPDEWRYLPLQCDLTRIPILPGRSIPQ